MLTGLKFFLMMFVCLICGILLAMPIYNAGWLDYPMHRVINRCAQLFILLGTIWYTKSLGLWTKQNMGYGINARSWVRYLLLGLVAGLCIMIVPIVIELGLGVRTLAESMPNSSSLLFLLLKLVLSALVIGIFEETFFRGALYSAIRRNNSATEAILVSSVLFAILHFMKPASLPEGVAFDFTSMFYLLGSVFTGLFAWENLDSITTLFMTGLLLGMIRERSGNIALCVGIHAGAVIMIQLIRKISSDNPASAWNFLTGNYDGVIGWLVTACLVVVFLCLWLRWHQQDQISKIHPLS